MARSPDRATSTTAGLTSQPGDLRSAPWQGQETLPQQEKTLPQHEETLPQDMVSEPEVSGVPPPMIEPPGEDNEEPPGEEPPPAGAKPVASKVDQPVHLPPTHVASLGWQTIVSAIWLLGSLLWFTWSGVRIVRFRRLLGEAKSAPPVVIEKPRRLAERLGLSRRLPTVQLLPGVVSPMLWAFLGKPRLILPADLLDRLSEEQWSTLLAHELAHLRRRDHWVRFLELIVTGLYWWHPVVWWARRRIREAEEQCCDAWVVAVQPSARDYVQALLTTVDFLSEGRPAVAVPASRIGQARLLKRRVTMIMQGNTPKALGWGGLVVGLGLAAVMLPWGLTVAQEKAEEPPAAGKGVIPGKPVFPTPSVLPGKAVLAEPTTAPAVPLYEAAQASAKRRDSDPPLRLQEEADLLMAQLEAKRAQLEAATAMLELAKLRVESASESRKQGIIGAEAVANRKADVIQAEAHVAAKRAEVKQVEILYGRAMTKLKVASKILADEARNPPRAASKPSIYPSEPPTATSGLEERLRALEEKIDALMSRVESLERGRTPAPRSRSRRSSAPSAIEEIDDATLAAMHKEKDRIVNRLAQIHELLKEEGNAAQFDVIYIEQNVLQNQATVLIRKILDIEHQRRLQPREAKPGGRGGVET